jgi:hypothetical protein
MGDPLLILIVPAVLILTLLLRICKDVCWPQPHRLRSEDLPAPIFEVTTGRPLTKYTTLAEAREFVETGKVARYEKMVAASKATAQGIAVDKAAVLSDLV